MLQQLLQWGSLRGRKPWLISIKYSNWHRGTACGFSPAEVFVCDELLRKSVANRAEWNDRSLDLAVVFGERDKQILEAARTRLLPTSVGRERGRRNVLFRVLAKQQRSWPINKRNLKGKGKSKEENKGKTNKQLKAQKFFDKQRTQTANKKWTSGASAGQGWSAYQSWLGWDVHEVWEVFTHR